MLACLIPMLAGLIQACSWHEESSGNLPIATTFVGQARYSGALNDPLRVACGKWTLTPAQVERFFAISQRYPERPYSEFYQLSCDISGEIRADGRPWTFEINGGGTATWTSRNEVRHWGCSARECDSMLLLPTDGMSGE